MKALDFVIERPWKSGEEFLVTTVVEPIPQEFGLGHVPAPTGSLEDRLYQECAEIAGSGAAKLQKAMPDHPVEVRVLSGLVAESICHLANEWNADLIVMGSHGRKGFTHFLLGSVAEEVLKKAPCSVEIIKAKEKVKAAEAEARKAAVLKECPSTT
jgi:nucleotide-binding universal stress UspA family protein